MKAIVFDFRGFKSLKSFAILIGALCFHTHLTAQIVDVEQLKNIGKEKLFKFGGNISANTILFTGNDGSGREPFTYFANGTLNCKIANLIDVPISFNLTNLGNQFNLPTTPSRFSLHPKYKSITAHIGDITMSYSPYTFNGFQFRGAAFDYAPAGKFSFSVVGGRLQKASEFDSSNRVADPAYQRFGYGFKANYNRTLYQIGMSVFAAKDNSNSLTFKPDSLNIKPQQNLAMSFTGSIKPTQNIELGIEYATSALTRDIRDTTPTVDGKARVVNLLMPKKNSTSYYKAIKANLNYRFKTSLIGVGYERVDPGYETLGAYFFNNDLENITLNFTQPLFKGKGQLTGNFGIQKDNLDNTKIGSNQRAVYSFAFNYSGSEKWSTNLNYSNFRTFMFVRPIFLTINQTATPYQNLDTLDYSQVSQNANLTVTRLLQKSNEKIQSLNLNVNFLNSTDRQGGVLKTGAASNMLFGTLGYTYYNTAKETGITTAINTAYNTIGSDKFITAGPMVSISKKLFKKINSSLSTSFNVTYKDQAQESNVFVNRLNLAYSPLNKQNFNFSLLHQAQNTRVSGSTSSLVATVGYNYFF